jgi:hypothetical protein
VGLTLLMTGFLKLIVTRPTIVDESARPVDAQEALQGLGATLRVDVITGDAVITDPGMEPGGVSSDPPTGFVRRDDRGVFQLLPNLLISGLESTAGAERDLG